MLEVQSVKDLLESVPPEKDKEVTALIRGLISYINGTYVEAKIEKFRDWVIIYVADVVKRRLSKDDPFLVSETAGPFNVRYSEAGAKTGLFFPSELADLSRVLGNSGSQTYRTAAPDAQRYANIYRPRLESGDFDDEYF